MTDLDILYEEVFGDDEEIFSEGKFFTNERAKYMWETKALVHCINLSLKLIKKISKKYPSNTLVSYQNELNSLLPKAKELKRNYVRDYDTQEFVNSMNEMKKKMNKYIVILGKLQDKYAIYAGSSSIYFDTSDVKSFDDYVRAYKDQTISTGASMGAGIGVKL